MPSLRQPEYTRGAVTELPPKPERVRALARFISARWYGVSRARLLQEFSDWYGDAKKLGERRFYRDVASLPKSIVKAGVFWVPAERVKLLPETPDAVLVHGRAA